MTCECDNWARNSEPLFTSHHRNCKQYDPQGDARKVIESLLKGVEEWGAEEDGIYPECWEAYKRAKVFVGQFDFKETE